MVDDNIKFVPGNPEMTEQSETPENINKPAYRSNYQQKT